MNSHEIQNDSGNPIPKARSWSQIIQEGAIAGSLITAVIHSYEHNKYAAYFDIIAAVIAIVASKEGRISLKEIFTGNLDVLTPDIRVTPGKPDK